MNEFEKLCNDVEEAIREAQAAYARGNWRGAMMHAQTARHLSGDAEKLAKRHLTKRALDGAWVCAHCGRKNTGNVCTGCGYGATYQPRK